MNLVEMIGKYVPADVLSKMGSAAGLGSDETKNVASGAVPLVAAGLARMGSTEQGAGHLLELARQTGAEDMVDRSGDVIGSEESRRTLMERGGRILSSLFGAKGGAILDAFTAQTGASSSGTRSFLAMLAPLALGVLSRHARSQSLGGGALASMLSGQSGLLSGMLPGGLGKLLGSGTPGSDVPGPWRAAEPRAREVPSQIRTSEALRAAGRGGQRRPVGVRAVVAAIAFALLAWALLREKAPEGERQARTPARVAKGPMESMPGMQREPPSQGIDALASYSGANLEGQRFSLSEISFESGTRQLTPQSAQQVDRLAGVMRERERMRVWLEGERADSVREALAARGIAAERVSTAKMGSGQPGATGATPQEALGPLRVDVVVVEP